MPWIPSRFARPIAIVALLFLSSSKNGGDEHDRAQASGVASEAVRWPVVAEASAAFERNGDGLVVEGILPARVGPTGSISVASRGTSLTLSLESIGRSANRAHRTTIEAGRAIVDRGDVREWLVSTNTGLEHGFDLARRVAGAGDVAIRIAVEGARAIQSGRDVTIVEANGAPRFDYRDLVVVDATGAQLRSRMRARGDAIELAFDDRDAVYPVRVDPLVITSFQTLAEVMVELETNSLCGTSVAVRGDVAVVGCPFDDAPSLANAGAVLVFKRDPAQNTWSPAGRLVSPAPAVDQRFGRSVAFDGNSIAVGAPGPASSPGTQPEAYLYRLVNTTWTWHSTAKPNRQAGNLDFGLSVAVSGAVLLVGAPAGVGSPIDVGSGYVAGYTIPAVFGAATYIGETSGPMPADGDGFGESIAIFGTTAVVGAPRRDLDPTGTNAVTDAGAAYEYTFAAGVPSFVRELPDPSRIATGGYGADVAIGSNGIVVGKTHGGANTGVAFVFGRAAASVTPLQLAGDDAVSGDLFGASVAIDGTFVLVGAPRVAQVSPSPGAGAPGAAYLFVQDGSAFVQAAKLAPSADNDANGFDVAIDARVGVLGAPLDDEPAVSGIGNAGTAKAFVIPEYHFVHVTIPNGGGSVASTPAGIACPNDCVEVYGTTASVTLTPTAFSGYFLETVTGSCTAIPCTVDTTADRAVAFAFHAQFQDGAACDDSVQCLNGACVDGVCCNEPCAGGDSDCQACSIAAGGTINGQCTALSSTAAPTVTCRSAVDTCDVDDHCMPLNRQCPADGRRPIDFECRAAQNAVCDTAEVCDGLSPMCPPDVAAQSGVSCDDGNACSGTEACDGLGACVSSNPVVCIDDGNPCTVELCLNVVGCVSVAQPGCTVVDGGAFFPGDGGTALGPDLRGGGGCTCSTSGGRSAIHPVLLAGFAIVALLAMSRRNRLRRKSIARPD